MSKNLSFSRRTASVLLVLGIALSGCAGLSSAPSAALLQQIEAAQTRPEHEALVTYYEREAADARARAADHRKMARSYQAGRGGGSMPAHCNSIVTKYEGIAADYDGMAASHRQMAQEAKP